MKYKWPETAGTQGAFFVGKNNQTVETDENVKTIGIITTVVLILLLLYLYITPLRETGIKLNTFSISFEKCEKVGTTILIFVFLSLLQGLFASQGFYKLEVKKALVIGLNYFILLCWILFMFVFPFKSVNGIQKLSGLHGFIAACVIISLVTDSWLVYSCYDEYYNKKDLLDMFNSNLALTISACLAGVSMILHASSFRLSIKFIAFFELLTLIMFIFFQIYFIRLPPIPDKNLSCVIK